MPCGINEYVQILVMGVKTAKKKSKLDKNSESQVMISIANVFQKEQYILQTICNGYPNFKIC